MIAFPVTFQVMQYYQTESLSLSIIRRRIEPTIQAVSMHVPSVRSGQTRFLLLTDGLPTLIENIWCQMKTVVARNNFHVGSRGEIMRVVQELWDNLRSWQLGWFNCDHA